MKKFEAYASSSPYDIYINANLAMENPLRYQCDYVIDDGDCFFYSDNIEKTTYQNALRGYLLTCLDYRFEEQLAEFSQEEIKDALSDYEQCIGISRSGNESGPYTIYEDLCANKYYYGASFSTLYEILIREGFSVNGDSWHYRFTGIDGSNYEISYDFCNYEHEDSSGEIHLRYYYLKDGEQIPMSAFFYNHFSEQKIKEMTGLILLFADPETLANGPDTE